MSKRVVIIGWADSVHVQRWARGMSGRGFDITVISGGGQKIDGLETRILKLPRRLSYLSQAMAAGRITRAASPDLLHVHYVGGFGLWGLASRVHPILLSVWGADVIDLPSNPLYRLLIRRSLRRADYVTTTSVMLKEATIKLQPTAADKIKVIPFGVSMPDPIPPPDDRPLKICFIKSLRPKYGPDVLIKAMSLLKKDIPDIQLNMAGDGHMKENLAQMIDMFDLQTNVTMAGFIQNEQITRFISDHHLMVMPSTMESESFGVAVLEASAAGRAVVASRVGGVPEVVVNGRTGVLVPPNDPEKLAETILNLAQDRKLLQSMGREGRRFVQENYTWEKSLDLMAELYDRLIYEKEKHQ